MNALTEQFVKKPVIKLLKEHGNPVSITGTVTYEDNEPVKIEIVGVDKIGTITYKDTIKL